MNRLPNNVAPQLLFCSWDKPEHPGSTLAIFPYYTLAVYRSRPEWHYTLAEEECQLSQVQAMIWNNGAQTTTTWSENETSSSEAICKTDGPILAKSPSKPPMVWTCSNSSMLNIHLLHKVRPTVCMCREQIQIPNSPTPHPTRNIQQSKLRSNPSPKGGGV